MAGSRKSGMWRRMVGPEGSTRSGDGGAVVQGRRGSPRGRTRAERRNKFLSPRSYEGRTT
jgi:hypothetical protein